MKWYNEILRKLTLIILIPMFITVIPAIMMDFEFMFSGISAYVWNYYANYEHIFLAIPIMLLGSSPIWLLFLPLLIIIVINILIYKSEKMFYKVYHISIIIMIALIVLSSYNIITLGVGLSSV